MTSLIRLGRYFRLNLLLMLPGQIAALPFMNLRYHIVCGLTSIVVFFLVGLFAERIFLAQLKSQRINVDGFSEDFSELLYRLSLKGLAIRIPKIIWLANPGSRIFLARGWIGAGAIVIQYGKFHQVTAERLQSELETALLEIQDPLLPVKFQETLWQSIVQSFSPRNADSLFANALITWIRLGIHAYATAFNPEKTQLLKFWKLG